MLDNELTILEKAFIQVEYIRMMAKIYDDITVNYDELIYLTVMHMGNSKT